MSCGVKLFLAEVSPRCYLECLRGILPPARTTRLSWFTVKESHNFFDGGAGVRETNSARVGPDDRPTINPPHRTGLREFDCKLHGEFRALTSRVYVLRSQDLTPISGVTQGSTESGAHWAARKGEAVPNELHKRSGPSFADLSSLRTKFMHKYGLLI